jgi:catechol 2,3-dioxygenase-like lactoylglutathione lyase family enzyme
MYDYLFVGVRDMDESLRLWSDVLGLSVSHRDPSECRSLEQMWALESGSIKALVLLETPGAPGGRLVLVKFATEAPSVRAGAQAFDLCPKNLDVNVVDFHARVAELVQAGYSLRSEPVSYSIGDLEVWEVQVIACDDVNLVLAEIIGEKPALTKRHCGAVTSVVTTVLDIEQELLFYQGLGFARLTHHHLQGPEIEKMIGLPSGASLHMQLLGDVSHRFGRAELIKYEKVTGMDLYPRIKPPVIGFFRGAVLVQDIKTHLQTSEILSKPQEKNLFGHRIMSDSVCSPSGFNIDLYQLT